MSDRIAPVESGNTANVPSPSIPPHEAPTLAPPQRIATPQHDEMDDVVARIDEMDAFLSGWREETTRRRDAWERERHEAALRRERNRSRVAFALAALGLAGAAYAWIIGGPATTPLQPPATTQAVASPPPAPVVVTPAAEEAAPSVPPADVIGDAPNPEIETAAEPAESAPGQPAFLERAMRQPPFEEPYAFGAARVEPASVRTWTDETYRWVEFDVVGLYAAYMVWRDANGDPVLDAMQCVAPDDEGVRKCRAGRRLSRIAKFVHNGAAAGTWTVSACSWEGCTDVSTFVAP